MTIKKNQTLDHLALSEYTNYPTVFPLTLILVLRIIKTQFIMSLWHGKFTSIRWQTKFLTNQKTRYFLKLNSKLTFCDHGSETDSLLHTTGDQTGERNIYSKMEASLQIVLKISSGSRRSWPLFNRTDSLKQPYIPLVKYIVISDMDA